MRKNFNVKRAVATSFALILLAAGAVAEETHHTAMPSDQMKFNPGPATLPPGAQIAILHGHPAQEGPFVIRLKFPSGYEVPPHRHSKEEHVTIISGAFGMGGGEIHNRDSAPLLAPGGFVRIPAGMPHFAWTKDETVVQINGVGPFDVQYVDPADDPRKKVN